MTKNLQTQDSYGLTPLSITPPVIGGGGGGGGAGLTPEQLAQLALISAPYVARDKDDPTSLKGFTDLSDALHYVDDTGSFLLLQGPPTAELNQSTGVSNVRVYGRGHEIQVMSGAVLTTNALLRFYGVSLSTLTGGTVNGSLEEVHDAALRGSMPPVARIFNTNLDAASFTSAGSFALYGSTTDPLAISGGALPLDLRPQFQRGAGTYSIMPVAGSNLAGGTYGTVSGGVGGNAYGAYSTVGGGSGNSASGIGTTVAGGSNIYGGGNYSAAAGGQYHNLFGNYSAIGGGYNGRTNNDYTFLGGGYNSTVGGAYSVVGGGNGNSTSGTNAFLGGGTGNSITGNTSTLAGGLNNAVPGNYAFLGGGLYGTASGLASVVVGGQRAISSGDSSFVGAGRYVSATGFRSIALGGQDSTASGYFAYLYGGINNVSSGSYAGVLGGANNTAAGDYSTVDGFGNSISGAHCHAYGSQNCTIDSTSSSVTLINCQNLTITGQVNKTYIDGVLYTAGGGGGGVDPNALQAPAQPDGTRLVSNLTTWDKALLFPAPSNPHPFGIVSGNDDFMVLRANYDPAGPARDDTQAGIVLGADGVYLVGASQLLMPQADYFSYTDTIPTSIIRKDYLDRSLQGVTSWVKQTSEQALSTGSFVLEGTDAFDKRYRLLGGAYVQVNPAAPVDTGLPTPVAGQLITFRVPFNEIQACTVEFSKSDYSQSYVPRLLGLGTTVVLQPGEELTLRVNTTASKLEGVSYYQRGRVLTWTSNKWYYTGQTIYASNSKRTFVVLQDHLSGSSIPEPSATNAYFRQQGFILPPFGGYGQILGYNGSDDYAQWVYAVDSPLSGSAQSYTEASNGQGSLNLNTSIKNAIAFLEKRSDTLWAGVARYFNNLHGWDTFNTYASCLSALNDTQLAFFDRYDGSAISSNLNCYGSIVGFGQTMGVNATLNQASNNYYQDLVLTGSGTLSVNGSGATNLFSLRGVRSSLNLLVQAGVIVELDSNYVATAPHTITYAGTLIIHPGADLKGVTLTASGGTASLDDRRMVTTSPDGTRWRLVVANDGTVSAVAA